MAEAASRNALVFRGWGYEADRIVEILAAAGISGELKDGFVPVVDGIGAVVVCEVFVPIAKLSSAKRAIAPFLSKRSSI